MNRYARYEGLFPVEKLREQGVDLIGCGAIGRQVALQLVALGVENLRIFDPDVVDVVNLGTQGWAERDVSRTKCAAIEEAVKRLNESVAFRGESRRFRRADVLRGRVVFMCVDTLRDRGTIFRWVWPAPLLVDTRMQGEAFEVYAAWDDASAGYYRRSLVRPGSRPPGRCTEATTIYAANVCAGFAVQTYTAWLRGSLLEPELNVNLLARLIEEPEEVPNAD